MGIGNDWIGKIDPNMPGQQVHVHVPACMCTVQIKKHGKIARGNLVHRRGCGE